MILLDTDHVTHLQYPESEAGRRLIARLRAQADRQVATTIISVEESFRGWVGKIGGEPDIARQIPHYQRLADLFRVYGRITLIPFDQAAAAHFVSLRRIRIGAMDKKIASIAITNQALLLTGNRKDFEQVPSLTFADWSA